MAATAYKYYAWEQNEFRDLCNITIDEDIANKINKKLTRHYKFCFTPLIIIVKRYNRGRGQAQYSNRIWIGPQTSLNVFIHEWAHLLNYRDGGEHHGKKFKKWHKKVVNYVRAKNYFGLLDSL